MGGALGYGVWLLQRDEIVWIFLAGAAISLIALYLASVLPRWRRRLLRPGPGSPPRQHLRTRLPRHRLIFVSAGFLAVIIFWSSLRVIEGGHRGVVFHLVQGVQERTLGEGIHFLLPVLHRLTVYDMRSRVYYVQSRAEPSRRGPGKPENPLLWTPTADGLKVGLDLSVRYRLDPTRLPELHRNVGPQFEEKVVHPIAWNVTRLVASEYSLLDVYGKHRHEIQQQAFERVKALFARDGLICEALLLRDVMFTEEFEKTLVTKMIAEQKVQESAFEVEQAGLHAQVQVIEARGE
ncbi:MAG: prohibitin family protein, partial [Nitrospinae bacterium]|nr:prohibitin family protein [Nitrospinota bacterium]